MNMLWYLIEKYPEKPWNWDGISRNPNITMEFIEKYPDKQWNWKWISKNPNITIKFIEKNINKIDFSALSSNNFTYQNELNHINNQKQAFRLLENLNLTTRLPKLVNIHIVKRYL